MKCPFLINGRIEYVIIVCTKVYTCDGGSIEYFERAGSVSHGVFFCAVVRALQRSRALFCAGDRNFRLSGM